MKPAHTAVESEEVLIRSVLQGRTNAFADLIEPHLTFLSRFARTRLPQNCDVEDVVQGSVMRAFRHLGQFRGEASFKTWLSAIVLNEAIQTVRRKSFQSNLQIAEGRAARLPDLSTSPHTLCQRKEESESLHRA